MGKKFFYYSVICLIFLLFQGNVSKAGNFYIGGLGGVTLVSDSDVSDEEEDVSAEASFDTGFVFGGTVGYDFGYIRTEGEISYRQNDLDELSEQGETEKLDGDISSLSFMANGFFEYENESRFTPYAGGGIGIARVEIDNDESYDDTVFAYQIGAGLSYAATDKLSLDLSYRFLGTTDPNFDDFEAEYHSHNIVFGLRYNF